MKTILLTDGKIAMVDDEDYDYLNQFKWTYCGGYAIRCHREDSKSITDYMHRVVIGSKKGDITDHINGIKLDNRKSNLRSCTYQENNQNRPSHIDSSSKYLGVSKTNKRYKDKTYSYWKSQIKFGEVIYLGLFKTEELAAIAYNEAAKKYFGEYANINKIEYGKS